MQHKKSIIFLISLALFIEALLIPAFSYADSVYVRPKKTVYLVMDDSGSMSDEPEWDANYALQTFVATLDKDDEVFIYFLNDKNALEKTDISKKSNAMIDNIRKKYPPATGSTPFDSVEKAAQRLIKNVEKDSKREYWLVVITDGGFDYGSNVQNYLEKFSKTKLKNGQYPNFMYFGIGAFEAPFSVPKGCKERVFIYSGLSVIDAMNKATLDITNRQTINATNADKKTIRFNLPYPASNIVVLAQNKKAKITTYKANSDLNTDEVYDVKYPVKNPNLQYTTVCYITEKNSSSISPGEISLTFDTGVSGKNMIVLVEPSIGISARYTGEGGQEIDPNNAIIGQTVQVEMDIVDPKTKKPLDDSQIFGDVKQKIKVNGKEYSGKSVDFVVDKDELDVTMTAEFFDGFVLDIKDKYSNLQAPKNYSLFISDSGQFSSDIKDLKKAKGLEVTPLINGYNIPQDEFPNTQLSIPNANALKNRFTIEKDDKNGVFIIHPKAGIGKIFTPKEEQDFEVVFTTSDGIEVRDSISVEISGKRPYPEYILLLLLILLTAYLIWVEVTRKRFPKGSYLKYYTVTSEGKPDGPLTDRKFLNRFSFEKLKNGSYLPIPNCSYKVGGMEKFPPAGELHFEAFDSYEIKVSGIYKVELQNSFGIPVETKSFIPIDENGNEITTAAPDSDHEKDDSKIIMTLNAGRYLRDLQKEVCIRYSTRSYDKLHHVAEL